MAALGRTGDSNALDEALEQSLHDEWNGSVIDYDEVAFDFVSWALRRLSDYGYQVASLEDVHRVVPDSEVFAVTKQLCADTEEADFWDLVVQLVWDRIVPVGKLVPPIAIQRRPNIRIFLPGKPAGTFPFHTGLLYGHGPASRSIWMPLTDVSADAMRSASMQIIDVRRSRELVAEAKREAWSVSKMQAEFGRESVHCKAGPGRMVLFGQENLHGNFVNETGKTRVSIDFRLAEARYGHLLSRKIPAGYFHFLREGSPLDGRAGGTTVPGDIPLDRIGRAVSYLSNNTSAVFATPVHLQRLMLKEYCGRHAIQPQFEFFELEGMDHLPTLEHIVGDVRASVVLYSIFALPEDERKREQLLRRALANQLTLFFVNEELVLHTVDDLAQIEAYLAFARFGASPVPVGLPRLDAAQSSSRSSV